jgi:hypothetical protein
VRISATDFRVITFEEPQLRGAEWVQIAMGAAFATRTYSPIEWDVVAGRTRIVGYVHGDAPGRKWVSAAWSPNLRPPASRRSADGQVRRPS